MQLKISKIISTTIIQFTMMLMLFSCQEKAETQADTQPIQFLALGDSYTIGQSVDSSDRWPIQLDAKLKNDGYAVSGTDIIAQTGWKTNDLLNAIEGANLEDYNLISLSIGVNNQFSGIPFEVYTSEFDELLGRIIDAVGASRVFVVSIPDYGVTPFGSNNSETIAQELDEYNEYARLKCDNLNIPYINITEISRDLGASEGALAIDDLHPSGTQYALWVDEIVPKVKELIGE
jgi:lysophospholipase L1-like esterase